MSWPLTGCSAMVLTHDRQLQRTYYHGPAGTVQGWWGRGRFLSYREVWISQEPSAPPSTFFFLIPQRAHHLMRVIFRILLALREEEIGSVGCIETT